MMDKAQAAVEYMVVLAISLGIFATILYFSTSLISTSHTKVGVDSAFRTVQAIKEAADYIYLSDHPSKTQKQVRVPQSVEEVEISEKVIRVRVASDPSYTDIYAVTRGNLTSYLPLICSPICKGGNYVLEFESLSPEFGYDLEVLSTHGPCETCPGETYCVDGVCCDSLCSGVCQSCNYPGHEETCYTYPAGTDPYNECSPVTCTDYIYDWDGNDCLKYASSSLNGMCDGAGACADFSESCISGEASASCGSEGCKKACPSGGSAIDYDEVSEICYTSGQHGCPPSEVCNGNGQCVVT